MSTTAEHVGHEWLEGEYSCSICGARFYTQERADECAKKGIQENPFAVGLELMLFNDEVVRVAGLLEASHIDHKPGITFKLPEGMARIVGLPVGTPQMADAEAAQAMRERFLATR